MSVSDRLREHILGLIEGADDDSLANVIRMLETGGVGRSTSPQMQNGMSESIAFDDDEAEHLREEIDVTTNLFGPMATSAPPSARGPEGRAMTSPRQTTGVNPAPLDDNASVTLPATASAAAVEEEPAALRSSHRAATHRRAGVRDAPVILEDARTFEPRVIEKSPAEIEELMRVVDTNPLFAALERRDKEKIVMSLDRQDSDAGTNILTQGETSPSRFYLIFDGTVNVIKNGKSVAAMGRGQTFGELEMMYDTNEPNAATVRAITDVALWWLDRPTYKNIVLRATLEKRELYLSLLNKVAFLEGMTEYDKNTLADALGAGHYRNGDHIIKFGEKGNWMHFIVEGTVQVVGRDKGKKVDIIRLGPGECVGELEFLFNHLTVADVVAVGPVVTAKMNRKHFEMCMGPITNDLKRHVAKGNYEHYLKEAGAHVLDEISAVEKKLAKKSANAASNGAALLANFDPCGEILIGRSSKKAQLDDAADKNAASTPEIDIITRFPLKGLERALNPCFMTLREDGSILSWSPSLENITRYAAKDVIGQSIYSYLASLKDQTEIHAAIARATKFAGDADGFHAEIERQNAAAARGDQEAGEDGEMRPVRPVYDLFTFSRSDGLTKSTIQLMVLPPIAAAAAGQAETVLCIGLEKKKRPPQKEVEPGDWLAEQIKEELNQLQSAAAKDINSEPPTSARGDGGKMESATAALDLISIATRLRSMLTNYEQLQQRAAGEQNLHSVNIRQLVGQVVSQCQSMAVANNNTINVTFADALPDEIFVDTTVVPEVLKYGIAKAAKHAKDALISVSSSPVTDRGLEYFEVAVHDNASSIDNRVLNAFRKACGGNPPQWFANSSMDKVRQAVSKLGGQMLISSAKNSGSTFQFRFPYIVNEETPNDEMGPVDMSASSKRPARMTFTTLVVEERPVHRNMLNASLWERKHAVMPANTTSDVLRLLPACDIIVADPGQSILASGSIQDPVSFLRNQIRSKAVIITAESFDEDTRNAYHQAGFFTLTKPFTAIQAVAVFRKAEDVVAKFKAEESKIEAMRNVFTGNGRSSERAPWQKGRQLGKGAFGEVFEAIDTMTGGKMAVKILRIGPKVNKREIIAEIETMCQLRHKNIIHYFYAEDASDTNGGGSTGGGALIDSVKAESETRGTKPAQVAVMDIMGNGPDTQAMNPLFDDSAPSPAAQVSYLHVFMEFAAGGTLQGKLDALGRGMDMKEMVPILRDVVEGIIYVHSQRFVHCDLKTANVLFGIDGRAKLGDFGTARRLNEGEKFYVMQGTPSYMSPECMSADIDDGIGYDFKTDIWSFGMMVLEMATGKPPLSHIPGLNNPMTLTKYITELADAPDLSVLFDAPVPVFELVRACVDVDPEKRPTAAQILDFAIFRQDGNEDLQSAMKALKRAQLLHMLNQFVAFYDPDEEQANKQQANKQGASGGKRAANSDDDEGSDDGGFFDSDDDESIREENSKSVNTRTDSDVPTIGKVGTAKDFFSSDDEDEEEDEAPPRKQAAAPAQAAIPEQQNGADDEDLTSPKQQPSGTSLLPSLAPHAPPEAKPAQARPLPSTTPPGPGRPASGNASTRSFTTAAVALHEALCNFLDRVSLKYSVPLDVEAARNRLKEQYRELQELARGNGTTVSGGSGIGAVDTHKFEPDGTGLLQGDTELLAKLSHDLAV